MRFPCPLLSSPDMPPALLKTARMQELLAKREQWGKSPSPARAGFWGPLRMWATCCRKGTLVVQSHSSASFLAESLRWPWLPPNSTPSFEHGHLLAKEEGLAQGLALIWDGWWLVA